MKARQRTYLFVLILLLLTIEINGPDIGLPAAITGKRVGVLLLAVLFVIQFAKRPPLPIAIRWALLSLGFVVFWINLSFLLSSNVSPGHWLGVLMAWTLIAFCFYAFGLFLPRTLRNEKDLFVSLMTIVGLLVNVLTALWLFETQGASAFFSPVVLGNAIENSLDCGMNRYLNGMFFWNMFPFAVALGAIKTRPRIYMIACAASAIFVVFSFLVMRRQTIGAIALYVVVLLLVSISLRKSAGENFLRTGKKRQWAYLIIGAAVLGGVTYALLSSEVIREELYRHIIEKTEVQYETEGGGRITVARDAWLATLANPIFGVGDFSKSDINTIGKATHNGYANLMVNSGFPPLIALLVLFSLCLVWGLLKHRRARENRDIWCASFSFLVVYLVWSTNLNDILREHMPFFALALMICSIGYATPTTRQSEHIDLEKAPQAEKPSPARL